MANTKQLRVSVQASNIGAGAGGDPFQLVITEATIAASSNPAVFWANVENDGGDLRAYDDDSQSVRFPIEVLHIDKGLETIVLWVRWPSVSSSVDTDIFLEFGDENLDQPTVGAPFGRNSVWSAEYFRAYHLTEPFNNSAGGYADSSGNADGTGSALTANGTNIYGLPSALASNTAGQKIDTGFIPDSSVRGISTWFKFATLTDSNLMGCWDDDLSATTENKFYMGTFFDGVPKSLSSIGSLSVVLNPSGVSTSTWHKLDGIWDGTTGRFFIDGVEKGSNLSGFNAVSTLPAYILRRNSPFLGDDNGIDGEQSDVTFPSVHKTPNHIAAEYLNQSSPGTFYDVGSVVTIGAPVVGFESWFAINSNANLQGL